MDKWLQDLHAARFIKLGMGDEDTSASKHGSIEADFQDWIDQLWIRVDKFRTVCQCGGSEQEKVCIFHLYFMIELHTVCVCVGKRNSFTMSF